MSLLAEQTGIDAKPEQRKAGADLGGTGQQGAWVDAAAALWTGVQRMSPDQALLTADVVGRRAEVVGQEGRRHGATVGDLLGQLRVMIHPKACGHLAL